MDQVERKYMVLLAKETNPSKAKELAAKIQNIRKCNEIRKILNQVGG